VRGHVIWGVRLSMYEAVQLRWHEQVIDQTGRMLARKMLENGMRAP